MARRRQATGPSAEDKAAEIRSLLQRYRQLPRLHHPALGGPLRALREAQLAGLREAHRADLDHAGYRALFDYYVDDLHSGLDLGPAIRDGERAFGLLAHMDESYLLLRNALEFGVLAQELDDALAATGAPVGSALQALPQRRERLQQMRLLMPMVSALAGYARNRIARAAFRIALVPLRATALAPLVRALDRGYEVLVGLDQAQTRLARLVDNNLRAVESTYRD
jgi:hypothetical protein